MVVKVLPVGVSKRGNSYIARKYINGIRYSFQTTSLDEAIYYREKMDEGIIPERITIIDDNALVEDTETGEEWKWIKGFEYKYAISSCGRLKSFLLNRNGAIRSLHNSKGDYLRIPIVNKESKHISIYIHRAVAEAFIGDIPKGYEVHHIDGNKQNNVVSNLEIISHKEHHRKTLEQHPDLTKAMNAYNKYGKPKHIVQYDLDGNFMAEYANGAIASNASGVCQRNILQVANQTEYKPGLTRKQAGGYIWKFKEESEVMNDVRVESAE